MGSRLSEAPEMAISVLPLVVRDHDTGGLFTAWTPSGHFVIGASISLLGHSIVVRPFFLWSKNDNGDYVPGFTGERIRWLADVVSVNSAWALFMHTG